MRRNRSICVSESAKTMTTIILFLIFGLALLASFIFLPICERRQLETTFADSGPFPELDKTGARDQFPKTEAEYRCPSPAVSNDSMPPKGLGSTLFNIYNAAHPVCVSSTRPPQHAKEQRLLSSGLTFGWLRRI